MLSDTNNEEQPIPPEQTIPQENINDNIAVWKRRISQLFLVGQMPREFFDFWYFCKKICPAQPRGLIFNSMLMILCYVIGLIKQLWFICLDAFLPVGLKLVGPYDVLAGLMDEFDDNDVEKTVLHWRYYYDPPEFQVRLIFIKVITFKK